MLSGLVGSGIQAVGSLINGIFDRRAQKKAQAAALAAQEKANQDNIQMQRDINAQNVASQEKINQMQLDQSKQINDIMRYDSKHAISDKVADMKRAGYSTADPSMQGFSAANLSSPSLAAPQQVAPHVDPVFDQSGVSNVINGRRSIVQNITDLLSTIADVRLKRSQEKNTDADTEGKSIDNSWKDEEKSAALAQIMATVDNLEANTDKQREEKKKISKDITFVDQSLKLLGEQIIELKFRNSKNEERFLNEMNHLKASVADLQSSKNLKDSEASLNVIRKRVESVRAIMAEHGVNFDGNGFFDSIARLAISPQGSQVLSQIGTFIFESLGSIIDLGKNYWHANSDAFVNSAKDFGEKSFGYLRKRLFSGGFDLFKSFMKTYANLPFK